MVFTTSCPYWRCWSTDCTSGYGRKMFNLLFAVVHHGQLLVSSEFSSLIYRGVDGLMLDCWLMGRGWSLPPFIDFCYLIGLRDLPWPYGWEDSSKFWVWPGLYYLVSILLQRKIIVSFRLSPLHLQTDDIFSLFSKILQHLAILMADLLLHILLHLLTYNAVQTVPLLKSYSTKNSNSGTIWNFNNVI